jgi:hypothetical protein
MTADKTWSIYAYSALANARHETRQFVRRMRWLNGAEEMEVSGMEFMWKSKHEGGNRSES